MIVARIYTSNPMIPAELLRKKRDAMPLDPSEISFLVHGIVDGTITSAQAAAFLMAACIRGLDIGETIALTDAMARSGVRYDWQHIGYAVDKHSTGGVGDKLSLLVAPIVAAAGAIVPMMSGRGLGHTGGTVDKLESVVGFRVMLDDDQIEEQLHTLGVVMLAQNQRLAPADRILYSLRDETGTVESIGLITASILSKKIAEGTRGLVLDVKVGRGAFMQRLDEAWKLAETLADVGRGAGLDVQVFITDMDDPLGNAAGNWVEVVEAERALADLSASPRDIADLTLHLSGAMLQLAGIAQTLEEGMANAEAVWQSGAAYERFHQMIRAQGGNWNVSVERYANIPTCVVESSRSGYVAGFATRLIGLTLVELGAGRRRANDYVDPAAGIVFHVRRGDCVEVGTPLATIYASNPSHIEHCAYQLSACIEIADEPLPPRGQLVLEQLS
ncbi:MAG: thymidine phosphorylase [Chlorobi bacterium]|nr:thymidine phosphorylase [Chlorobiota bacterium]